MIPVAEALRRTLEAAGVLGTERVLLDAALGRVAAEPVVSARAVPAADNSAMDGFAVRAADVAAPGARLRVLGAAPAGSLLGEAVVPGTAARIFTGSVIPGGADTVVRVEDTREADGTVTIAVAARPGANVRRAGEDIAPGAVVLEPGTPIGPADVGLLASIGRATVTVHRRPRVAILSTGAELVEMDEPAGRAQVVNSNAWQLAAAVRLAGGEPTVLPIARDTLDAIRAAFEEASAADVVLSTGGVSVGDFDFVKEALHALGVERLFWKVAQKPGRPLTVGTRAGRLFAGLPGNPVSALVCFWVYAWPALRRMGGHRRVHLPAVEATLAAEVAKARGLTEFVRVHLQPVGPGGWRAVPFAAQGSGVLSSLGRGAGLLVGPAAQRTLAAGSRHPVIVPSPEVVLGTVEPAGDLAGAPPADAVR